MEKIIFFLLMFSCFFFSKPVFADDIVPVLIQEGLPNLPDIKFYYTKYPLITGKGANGCSEVITYKCTISAIDCRNGEVGTISYNLSKNGSYMSNRDLWVDKGLRQQGIGNCLMNHAVKTMNLNNPGCTIDTGFSTHPMTGEGTNLKVMEQSLQKYANCPDATYKAVTETPTGKNCIKNGFEPSVIEKTYYGYKVTFSRVGPHTKVIYYNGKAYPANYQLFQQCNTWNNQINYATALLPLVTCSGHEGSGQVGLWIAAGGIVACQNPEISMPLAAYFLAWEPFRRYDLRSSIQYQFDKANSGNWFYFQGQGWVWGGNSLYPTHYPPTMPFYEQAWGQTEEEYFTKKYGGNDVSDLILIHKVPYSAFLYF